MKTYIAICYDSSIAITVKAATLTAAKTAATRKLGKSGRVVIYNAAMQAIVSRDGGKWGAVDAVAASVMDMEIVDKDNDDVFDAVEKYKKNRAIEKSASKAEIAVFVYMMTHNNDVSEAIANIIDDFDFHKINYKIKLIAENLNEVIEAINYDSRECDGYSSFFILKNDIQIKGEAIGTMAIQKYDDEFFVIGKGYETAAAAIRGTAENWDCERAEVLALYNLTVSADDLPPAPADPALPVRIWANYNYYADSYAPMDGFIIDTDCTDDKGYFKNRHDAEKWILHQYDANYTDDGTYIITESGEYAAPEYLICG